MFAFIFKRILYAIPIALAVAAVCFSLVPSPLATR